MATHKKSSRSTSKRAASNKKTKRFLGLDFTSKKTQLAVLAVFLVLFAGIGAYLVNSSKAYTCASYTCNTYRQGSSGTAVRYIQRILNAKGFNAGTVDGIFGSKTYYAARGFQSANRLTVDGIVGKNTWEKLCYAAYALPGGSDGWNAGKSAGCTNYSSTSVAPPSTDTGSTTRNAKIDKMTSLADAWSYSYTVSSGTTRPKVAYTSLSYPTSCARFVSEVVNRSAADSSFPRTALVADIRNYLNTSTGQSKWSVSRFNTGSRPSMTEGDVLLVMYTDSYGRETGSGHVLYVGTPDSRMSSGKVAFEAAINKRAPSQIPMSYVDWLVNKRGNHYKATLR